MFDWNHLYFVFQILLLAVFFELIKKKSVIKTSIQKAIKSQYLPQMKNSLVYVFVSNGMDYSICSPKLTHHYRIWEIYLNNPIDRCLSSWHNCRTKKNEHEIRPYHSWINCTTNQVHTCDFRLCFNRKKLKLWFHFYV